MKEKRNEKGGKKGNKKGEGWQVVLRAFEVPAVVACGRTLRLYPRVTVYEKYSHSFAGMMRGWRTTLIRRVAKRRVAAEGIIPSHQLTGVCITAGNSIPEWRVIYRRRKYTNGKRKFLFSFFFFCILSFPFSRFCKNIYYSKKALVDK